MSTPWLTSLIALERRLDLFNPAMEMARPGVAFTPSPGTPHLRIAHLAAGSDMASLGVAGTQRDRGIYQVSVYFPAGQGLGALLGRAAAVADHFKRLRLTEADVDVQCEVPQLGPVIPEADWVSVPVSVPFFVTTAA